MPIGQNKSFVQMLEPSAVCVCIHKHNGRRSFRILVGTRILAECISPSVARERALNKLLSERAVDHINGNPHDNRPANLRVGNHCAEYEE